ncbi:A-agglutinin anchorage subunit isoform X1 [Drosophila subpulchrella]|uniref:A-agglutinin anchorage subunit isoform X1 n=1 Tax=Drosophila subpulchrella TaxID=1486046 RepID=UPI0018A13301|nr:A-agglutinin anchorage subunit isoform X1 [Drosophila subpulchrella]
MLALAPPTTPPPPPRDAPLAAKSKSNRFSATAMLSNGSAGVAADVDVSAGVAGDCDERTLLLSEEIVVVAPSTSPPLPPSSSVGVAATAPPTSLPLVHTTTTTTAAAAAAATQHNNNNVNNNNNALLVVSAKNMANNKSNKNNSKCKNNEASSGSSNNNNAAEATAATTTTTTITSGDIEPATTTTTADEDDMSSDLSDKFPRPQKKPGKLSKLGTKSVGLKRVSFGSSKGSMVETLVFETPTPLSEHMESTFGFDAAADSAADTAAAAAGQPQLASTLPSHLPLAGGYSGDYAKGNMDDSGIEVQEESERSIVRVSIYQSSQPQQICPPADYLLDALDGGYNYNSNLLDYSTMATTAAGLQQQQVIGLGAAYDRQQSTDSGWDNPFRPGGDLSREADEIVNMIRGGKPITPTEERTIGNGSAQHADDNCNGGAAIGESVTRSNLSQNLATAQNGTNSHASASADAGAGKAATATELSGGTGTGNGNNGVTSLGQVSKQVVPGPTSASHVVIDEKKNKKKGCCVVQ